MRYVHPAYLLTLLLLLAAADPAQAQDTDQRYYRIYLKDKGTPDRVLSPSDPQYRDAVAHLTSRALKRRAKVLPKNALVSTTDLPVYSPYLTALEQYDLEVVEVSRWLNSAMVVTVPRVYHEIREFTFIDSIEVLEAVELDAPGVAKMRSIPGHGTIIPALDHVAATSCISLEYGIAQEQLEAINIPAAHRIGLAGEGVLVGILDAGFDWRRHASLSGADVIGEYDFVYGDERTYDEPGEIPSEDHGTLVMSIIGGVMPGSFLGGAPRVSFAIARTEDVKNEQNVEEDHLVAGLEYLEALGTDVTNISLGYTTFDPPEEDHSYEDLDGKTAFASRGVNHAVGLGMVCVVSAGNGYHSYRYVSVPAEADSAIAVAATNFSGSVASFSSRGFGGRDLIKPDVAAPGIDIYGASLEMNNGFYPEQGTSLAAPLVTSAVALLLSANPELTPWEIRSLLAQSAERYTSPDTAVGHGKIDVGRALALMSSDKPIVGHPKVLLENGSFSVASWIVSERPQQIDNPEFELRPSRLEMTVRNTSNGRMMQSKSNGPTTGPVRWVFFDGEQKLGTHQGDSLEITITNSVTGDVLQHSVVQVEEHFATPVSTLCENPLPPRTTVATAQPNPFSTSSVITFVLDRKARVSLVLFNSKGERVKRLISAELHDAGVHSIPVEPDGLTAGSYYYSLTVDEQVFSDALVFLK